MQTSDFVIIWLIATLTSLLWIAAGLVVTYLVLRWIWRVVEPVRRVGVVRFAKALVTLAAGVGAAIAKLFVFDRDDASRAKFDDDNLDILVSRENESYPHPNGYNYRTGQYDGGYDLYGWYD